MIHITAVFKSSCVILVTCRSGVRSALAVNEFATASFNNVCDITDGMEGDTVDDPQRLYSSATHDEWMVNSG